MKRRQGAVHGFEYVRSITSGCGWKRGLAHRRPKPVKNQDLWESWMRCAAARPRVALGQGPFGRTWERARGPARQSSDRRHGPVRSRPMRQIVLDTETTGLEPELGHRIIEIGCVELLNRRPTGRHFHRYVNPERDIDEGALAVHGISRADLAAQAVLSRRRRGAAGVHRGRRARDPQRGVRRRLPGCRAGKLSMRRASVRAPSHRCAVCSIRSRSRARCIPASATAWMRSASATRSTTRIASCTARCWTPRSSPTSISR